MIRLMMGLGLLGAVVAGSMFFWPPPPPGDGMGKGFKLGTLFPPRMKEELDLNAEQAKQLEALEAEVARRLELILTDEQRRTVEKLAKRPPQKGKDKKGGPPPGGDDQDDRKLPKRPDSEVNAGGINWFTSLAAGIAEARRTDRPILFVSAATSCAGVSGIW